MLETLIVILILLWLLGYFGRGQTIPDVGGLIHILIVIVIVILILRLI